MPLYDLFNQSNAMLFLRTLYGYRRQRSFQLHAFVLTPEHVHLLLTPAHDVTLERVMQLIKGGYSIVGLESVGFWILFRVPWIKLDGWPSVAKAA